MSKIKKHPVLEVPVRDKVIFKYNGQEVEGEKGYTIAAALHRAFRCIVIVWTGGNVRWNAVSVNVGLVKCWWMEKSGEFVLRKWME